MTKTLISSTKDIVYAYPTSVYGGKNGGYLVERLDRFMGLGGRISHERYACSGVYDREDDPRLLQEFNNA